MGQNRGAEGCAAIVTRGLNEDVVYEGAFRKLAVAGAIQGDATRESEPAASVPFMKPLRDLDQRSLLRFFTDGAAKKWPLRGSLKRATPRV
jgi:hypothetical protein